MKNSFSFSCFLAIFLCFNTGNLSAQYFEVGVNVGGANYLGDLSPSQLWTSAGDVNLAGGAMVRLNWTDWISLRAGFHYGKVTAADANAKTENSRRRRNLSFRSNIYEASLTTELNILGYRPYLRGKSFAPFLSGGIAVFKFNPQAEWQGQWYDLQPLQTEGQTYALTQWSIPLGIGFKYALSTSINLGFEAGMRKTFTDYLDDVSGSYPDLIALAANNGSLAAELSWRTDELEPEAKPPLAGARRGDPDDLDWYIFTGIFVSYNFIGNGKARRGQRNSVKNKCPTF